MSEEKSMQKWKREGDFDETIVYPLSGLTPKKTNYPTHKEAFYCQNKKYTFKFLVYGFSGGERQLIFTSGLTKLTIAQGGGTKTNLFTEEIIKKAKNNGIILEEDREIPNKFCISFKKGEIESKKKLQKFISTVIAVIDIPLDETTSQRLSVLLGIKVLGDQKVLLEDLKKLVDNQQIGQAFEVLKLIIHYEAFDDIFSALVKYCKDKNNDKYCVQCYAFYVNYKKTVDPEARLYKYEKPAEENEKKLLSQDKKSSITSITSVSIFRKPSPSLYSPEPPKEKPDYDLYPPIRNQI